MKKAVWNIIMFIILLSLLTACGGGKAVTASGTPADNSSVSDASTTDVKPSVNDTPSDADTSVAQPAEEGKDEADSSDAVPNSSTGETASKPAGSSTKAASNVQLPTMKSAYRAALEQIITERKLPDGTEIADIDEFSSMSDNKFAIYDIDSDGKDELIVVIVTGPTAGMMEHIYGYAENTCKLILQLAEFPALTYYSDGHIKAEWSHNQGLAGESFWPYTLYTYDAQNDSYKEIAMVDAWDKKIRDKNYLGEAFPDEIDANGDGIVFMLNIKGLTKTLSKKDYDSWYKQQVGDATEIKLDLTSLTQENIAALD